MTWLLTILFVALWSDSVARVHVASKFKVPKKNFYRFWFKQRLWVLALTLLGGPWIFLAACGTAAIVHQVQVNRHRGIVWWNLSNSMGDPTRSFTDRALLYLARQNEKVAALILITLASLAVFIGGAGHFWTA